MCFVYVSSFIFYNFTTTINDVAGPLRGYNVTISSYHHGSGGCERQRAAGSTQKIQKNKMWGYTKRKEILPSSGTSAWNGRMRKIRELGKGTYGTVWLARSSKDGLVAVKELILRRGRNDVDAIENEIDIMQKIRGHRNVLNLYEYYRSNTAFQLVLQYCQGGEILDTITQRRGLSENEAKVIMKQTFDVSCIYYYSRCSSFK